MALYMVIERFKGGDAVPVYRRFRDRGRLAPSGLTYVSSWVDTKFERCYQLMEAEDASLLDQWIAQWSDLVDFEVHPVVSSREAAERIARLYDSSVTRRQIAMSARAETFFVAVDGISRALPR
jgi:hypothetical protein